MLYFWVYFQDWKVNLNLGFPRVQEHQQWDANTSYAFVFIHVELSHLDCPILFYKEFSIESINGLLDRLGILFWQSLIEKIHWRILKKTTINMNY